jgi:putative ABC transport system permease protein
MFALALRNLWSYKRRLLTSAFSVVLGISFLSGSFVFTDTLKGLFSDLFSSSVKGIDVVVRAKPGFGGSSGASDDGPYGDGRALVSVALADKIAKIDGVFAAEPSVQGYAQLLDKKKKLVRNGQAPTFGFSWTEDPELAAYKIFSGRKPTGDDEIVVDRALIKLTGFKVGDKVKVVSTKPVRQFTIVGDATFGASDGALGSTASFFTQKTAQELAASPGQAQTILIRAKKGISQEELARRVSASLSKESAIGGAKLETLTGAALDKETQGFVNTFFKWFNVVFSSFALISLFVSIFVISNSFSIVVKQRTREMATLRTLGASSRQILNATFLESLVVGFLASLVGVFSGVGVAIGIRALLTLFGFGGLPSSDLLLKPRTVVLGLFVGTLVTVLSAIAPAIRASRIKPLAALRDTEVDDAAFSKTRLILGLIVIAASVCLLALGLTKKGGDGALIVGIAAALGLIGVIFIGPVLARPVAGALGRPWFGAVVGLFGIATILGGFAGAIGGVASGAPALIILAPLGLLIGGYLVLTAKASPKVSGQIARENAVRNPTRTSATALALTIGTALVSAILLLSQSISGTLRGTFETAIRADYIVSSGSELGIPGEVSEKIAKVPGVVASSGKRTEQIKFGFPLPRSRQIAVIDPINFTKVFDLGRVVGTFEDLSKPDTLAVAENSAKDNNYKIGDKISASFRNGARATLQIVAFYQNAEGLNNTYFVTSESTMSKYVPKATKDFVYVRTNGKSSNAFERDADKALENYPTATLQTKAKFVDGLLGQVVALTALINALLFLAIVIAVLGIANTLRLAILERTREIGLLRAVGMSRQQLKDSIRWEAIVVATFGAVVGLVIGTIFGSALVYVLGKDGSLKLTIPWAYLIGLTSFASLVGLYAARKPAKVAAKLNILQAIATE